MELSESAAIKEIQDVFSSDNESLIHDTISYIHENGSVKMMSLLFNLLAKTTSDSLKKDVYNCLVDTKNPDAVAVFISALQNPNLISEKKEILATMWQTNMDFSKHAGQLVDILLNDTYETAIEAFTVLEVCSENIDDSQKQSLISVLTEGAQKDKSEKATLLQEAARLLTD
ncbi:MAG: hypothetical protein MJ204_08250 [Bacteroidales bacterium]|nr:hypothetical protein [Bacteroidales bacterium]